MKFNLISQLIGRWVGRILFDRIVIIITSLRSCEKRVSVYEFWRKQGKKAMRSFVSENTDANAHALFKQAEFPVAKLFKLIEQFSIELELHAAFLLLFGIPFSIHIPSQMNSSLQIRLTTNFFCFHYCNLIKLQKSKNMCSISIFPPRVSDRVSERE